MAQNYINKINVNSTDYLIEPTLYIEPTVDGTTYKATLDNFALVTGVTISVKFPITNLSIDKLNINATEDKFLKYNNSNIPAGMLKTNHIYLFVYDGINWQLIGDNFASDEFKIEILDLTS